jgi:predicted flavoprotein YhiN
MKNFPLQLQRPRPLIEAISSTGGVDLNEVNLEPGRELELKKIPGVFVGGEMLNWTAPTGGFLIQGAVTQGAVAGQNMLRSLRSEIF